MTDYPSIRPADVREGDVVRARFGAAQWPATIEGVVHFSLRDAGDNRLYVGGYVVSGATDLRLVSMGRCCTPPEPLLRVGDFVRCTHSNGMTGQIVSIDVKGWHSIQGEDVRWGASGPEVLTRIEPPVSWPVGVPQEDGGVWWYAKRSEGAALYDCFTVQGKTQCNWLGLIALGGVPALAVTG